MRKSHPTWQDNFVVLNGEKNVDLFSYVGKVEEPKWYPQDGITAHSKCYKMEFYFLFNMFCHVHILI